MLRDALKLGLLLIFLPLIAGALFLFGVLMVASSTLVAYVDSRRAQ